MWLQCADSAKTQIRTVHYGHDGCNFIMSSQRIQLYILDWKLPRFSLCSEGFTRGPGDLLPIGNTTPLSIHHQWFCVQSLLFSSRLAVDITVAFCFTKCLLSLIAFHFLDTLVVSELYKLYTFTCFHFIFVTYKADTFLWFKCYKYYFLHDFKIALKVDISVLSG